MEMSVPQRNHVVNLSTLIFQNYLPQDEDEDNLSKGSSKKSTCCPPKDGFKIIVAGCIIFGLALTIGLIVDTYTGKPPRGHGGIASDSGVCSNIGFKILHDQSGSAVDAAVAVALCETVVQPGSTGLSR